MYHSHPILTLGSPQLFQNQVSHRGNAPKPAEVTLSKPPLSWSIRKRGFHSSLPHSSDLSNSLPPQAYRIFWIHLCLHLACFPTPKGRIKYTCLKTHPCFFFMPPGGRTPSPVSDDRKPPRPLLPSPEILGNCSKMNFSTLDRTHGQKIAEIGSLAPKMLRLDMTL